MHTTMPTRIHAYMERCTTVTLLLLSLAPIVPSFGDIVPPPRGFYLNCGSSEEVELGSVKWIPDEGFTSAGNATAVKAAGLLPILMSLRYFPDATARKNCYTVPVVKGAKYMVRTSYYYGGFDGGKEPPVFDQIIGGTKWSRVNTSANYAGGMASYYEIIGGSQGKSLSVCLARNSLTPPDASPFISTLEVELLDDAMYNSTDFDSFALSTVARHRFGYDGPMISYPDDQFNRYWDGFTDGVNPAVECHGNVSSGDFWNLPPAVAFKSGLTTSRGKTLLVQWPPVELPETSYYVVLYFQDNRTPSPYSWRVFDVAVNGKAFFSGMNVSTEGLMVYGTRWPLAGRTSISLMPDVSSPVGPIINAGEIYRIVPLQGRTLTRDVIAMEELSRSFGNKPSDWSGDPCLPPDHAWTGVTCSQGKLVRVVSLNLTSQGITGSLPDSLGNLTAITSMYAISI